MTEITRRPARVSSWLAVCAATVAIATTGSTSSIGLLVGLLGSPLVALGLVRGYRSGIDLGFLLVFVGVLAGGYEGEAVGVTVIATVAVVLGWDLAHGGIDLGTHLGRESETTRLEAVHAVTSLGVGLIAGAVGYGVYVFASGGRSAASVVLLVAAAVLVTLALGSRSGD